MNFSLLSSVMTIISFIVFVGILFWVFSPKNKTHYEQMAVLPPDEENGE